MGNSEFRKKHTKNAVNSESFLKRVIIMTIALGSHHRIHRNERTMQNHPLYSALFSFSVLNVIDSNGNTALHWATEKNQVKCVQGLLDRGANPNILNNALLSPLHVAVNLHHSAVLEVLASNKTSDLNLAGELENTPVMLACSIDNHEGISILLSHGASLCKQNKLGHSALHQAAFSGAKKSLELILRKGMDMGYTSEYLLNIPDKTHCSPLHLALHGGNMETIKICIENGAKLDFQQDDIPAPLHFACMQGQIKVVKLILSKFTAANSILNVLDDVKQTPLHKAAMYDHSHLVEYLIEQGAEMNIVDCETRTPLLWAASRGSWKSVKVLLARGANVKIKNDAGCNFFHLTLLQPGGLKNLGQEILSCEYIQELLYDQDIDGCTPLHYACRQGLLDSVDKIMNLKMCLHIKTKDKKTPLHFAAGYGRLKTCQRLLQNLKDTKFLNEGDGKGMTPLLLAAQNGHTKVVQLLLMKGSLLLWDYEGWTSLHFAAAGGYSHTMKILLETNIKLIDQVDLKGNTALHFAASEGHVNAVRLLMTKGAAIKLNENDASFLHEAIHKGRKEVALAIVESERFYEAMCIFVHGSPMGCPVLEMIEHLPESFKGLLDKCMKESSEDKKNINFSIEYNFKYLQCPINYRKIIKGDKLITYKPLTTLNAMVKYNQTELLNHPVCKTYLQMKWRAYGIMAHVINMLLYSVLLLPMTVLILVARPHGVNKFPLITANFSLFFCVVIKRWQYLVDSSNLLDWIIYVMSIVFVTPWVLDMSIAWQWQCGIIAALSSWVNFLLFLQRFEISGIYVVMFAEILNTMFHIIILFFFLILAYGLTFYILLYEQIAYESLPLSLMKTLAMMLGDINYQETFFIPFKEGRLQFPLLTFIILLIFMLIIPILLMNLLIGLAVGDIASVQRNAKLKRMTMQIFLHTSLEKKLPKWFLKIVDQQSIKIYPNKPSCFLSFDKDSCDDETIAPAKLELQLEKQKNLLKDMSEVMQKQHELLQLIIQKLEINSETEDQEAIEHLHYSKAKASISQK
uniref:Transient receptor potential cation channel, subfamily A, member 1a n=1 Tax=Callorhinchus milii TaxID=7868 RepID=A0A4W3GKR7_CALMI